MRKLIFAKDETNQYIIADHNDEKLAVIARTLLNGPVVVKLKELLENLDQLADNYHIVSNPKDRFQFSMMKTKHNYIILSVTDQDEPLDEDNPLTIDMSRTVFLDLIDEWEELQDLENNKEIYLTRHEDVYTLTQDLTDL